MVLTAAVRCSLRVGGSRRSTIGNVACRGLASDGKGKFELPLGLGKIFGIGEPDGLIKTDRDRRIIKGDIPDFVPEDVRKDLDDLKLDSFEDLSELENQNLDGYADLGLVPPVGSGTYATPILIPSRRNSRTVGYTDPVSHALYWFNIHNDNNTYYIKDLGLFFKMLHIPDEDATEHH